METEFVNCSAENLFTVVNWLPSDLAADKVVFFPDACPSAAPLPTGVAVHIPRGEEWRKFALSDIGCGMLLLESDIPNSEVYHCEQWNKEWDGLGLILKENRNKLGDLGGGNHFLDAIVDYETDKLSFLIHTGSRNSVWNTSASPNGRQTTAPRSGNLRKRCSASAGRSSTRRITATKFFPTTASLSARGSFG